MAKVANSMWNQKRGLIYGAGVGASAAYLWDRENGKRRRTELREQWHRTQHQAKDAWEIGWEDLINRSRGLLFALQDLWAGDKINDAALVGRVRAKLGRVSSHPSSIEVRADQGRITLSGPILSAEVEQVLTVVSDVRGVKEIDNELEPHDRQDTLPGLQGSPKRPNPLDLSPDNWSPGARLLMGGAGGLIFLRGLRRGGFTGWINAMVGGALLARAATNQPVRKLIGYNAGRRVVDIQKTIEIEAPVERVFEVWSNEENFPKFMSNVKDVKKIDGDRTHWTVAGPAGSAVEWNAVRTQWLPSKEIAWKTEPDSTVQHEGRVKFRPSTTGSGTAVDIKLSYNPGAGQLGHAIAELFNKDPKTQMDEDLMRMKKFIEAKK